jgi:hypothetical protein
MEVPCPIFFPTTPAAAMHGHGPWIDRELLSDAMPESSIAAGNIITLTLLQRSSVV